MADMDHHVHHRRMEDEVLAQVRVHLSCHTSRCSKEVGVLAGEMMAVVITVMAEELMIEEDHLVAMIVGNAAAVEAMIVVDMMTEEEEVVTIVIIGAETTEMVETVDGIRNESLVAYG